MIDLTTESSSVGPGDDNSENLNDDAPEIPESSTKPVLPLSECLLNWMGDYCMSYHTAADVLKVSPSSIVSALNGATPRPYIHNRLAVFVPGIDFIEDIESKS